MVVEEALALAGKRVLVTTATPMRTLIKSGRILSTDAAECKNTSRYYLGSVFSCRMVFGLTRAW